MSDNEMWIRKISEAARAALLRLYALNGRVTCEEWQKNLEAENKRLLEIIDRTATAWLSLEPPVAWEGDVADAMVAGVAEIKRLGVKVSDEAAEKRNIRVQVRRNSDGAVSSAVWEEWMWYLRAYWWAEGNARCDCNREIFFCEGMGLEKPDFVECGDGRFDVHITDADTGEVLYSEFEEWSAKGVLKKLTEEVWALGVMGDASEKEAHEAITDVIRILREAGRIWDYKRIVMNLRDLRRVWPIVRESSDERDQEGGG